MADAAYWFIHVMVGLLGFVLSAISVRATVTVFFVLLVEILGLVGMVLPGGADVAFTLEMFGGLGLIIGTPVSVGRGKLAWWFLPVLAAGVFIALRVPLLLGEDWRTLGRGGLQTLVAAVALAGGMLAGRGLAALVARWRRRMTPKSSRKPRT
jgi:hypothetical protein